MEDTSSVGPVSQTWMGVEAVQPLLTCLSCLGIPTARRRLARCSIFTEHH